MLQLVVLQVKGLQRVEILESQRRYYLDAERIRICNQQQQSQVELYKD